MGCTPGKTHPGRQEDIRDVYKITKILGSGSFGQVRECLHIKTKQAYAVKIIEKKCETKGAWSNENMFRREVKFLQQLSHPNIISYTEGFEDRLFLYAILEKCDGGELFEQIVKRRQFRESDAAVLCSQMLKALVYLHNKKIVHRDIKAENFLFKTEVKDSPLVLIDFGMAVKLEADNDSLKEVCGSPHYLAPELIKQDYGMKADIWALGVLTFLMLFGKYPFDGPNTNVIVREIMTKQIDFSSNSKISSKGVEFMKRLLTRNPNRRLSAAEALEHSWVAQKDEEEEAIIPMETVRTAHRKVTITRQKVDKMADDRRTLLLEKLENQFLQGTRTSIRLAQVSEERPEFYRHNKRISTTPSRVSQRTSIGSKNGDSVRTASSADMGSIAEHDLVHRKSGNLDNKELDTLHKLELARRKMEKRSYSTSEVLRQKRGSLKLRLEKDIIESQNEHKVKKPVLHHRQSRSVV
eukprot:Platyproteum_vivax@DN5828_c0_g1_i1.p1